MIQLDAMKLEMLFNRLFQFIAQGRKKEVKTLLKYFIVSRDEKSFNYKIYCPVNKRYIEISSVLSKDFIKTKNSLVVIENHIRLEKLKKLQCE
jgi:hypothetical protein